MRKATRIVFCIVALLMLSAVSYAKQPSFIYKAVPQFVYCESNGQYQLVTAEYGSTDATSCYDVTAWMSEGSPLITGECIYTYPFPEIDEADVSSCERTPLACDIMVKGSSGDYSTFSEVWQTGGVCSNEISVDNSEIWNKKHTINPAISYIAVTGCVAGTGCVE